MGLKELLTDAKKIDDLVQSIWQKYDGMEGQDMPREDNWMLEYAILNRGHDFLNYFLALNEFQKELEAHEGEFCYSNDESSHNGSYLVVNDVSNFRLKRPVEGQYSNTSYLFQLQKPGLTPNKIRSVYNPETEKQDFKVSLGLGAENAFLESVMLSSLKVEEFADDYCCLYFGENDHPSAVKSITQQEPLIWRMSYNGLATRAVKIVIGNEAVLKNLKDSRHGFMLANYDSTRQTPIEYIQSMKGQERKRRFPF